MGFGSYLFDAVTSEKPILASGLYMFVMSISKGVGESCAKTENEHKRCETFAIQNLSSYYVH